LKTGFAQRAQRTQRKDSWEHLGTPTFKGWIARLRGLPKSARRLPRDNPKQASRRKRPFFLRRRDTGFVFVLKTGFAQRAQRTQRKDSWEHLGTPTFKGCIARLRGLPKSARWLPRDNPTRASRRKRSFFSRRRDTVFFFFFSLLQKIVSRGPVGYPAITPFGHRGVSTVIAA